MNPQTPQVSPAPRQDNQKEDWKQQRQELKEESQSSCLPQISQPPNGTADHTGKSADKLNQHGTKQVGHDAQRSTSR